MERRHWMIVGIVLLVAIVFFAVWPSDYCRSALSDYGIEVPECPDGKVRQTLRIHGNGLRRGGKGTVSLQATAHYTVELADEAQSAAIQADDFEAKISIIDLEGKATPLTPETSAIKPRKGWTRHPYSIDGLVELPKLRDGDYKLQAEVKTPVGTDTVALPLALYAPARIHVLTDRPLYEAGNRIKFRALVVRARDLTPIDHRPGTWLVTDPAGNVLLEEKAPAGEWGIVAGSFLLDKQAPTGSWTITWRSGKDQAYATVKVEPFTLPRFTVSASPQKPFYQPGDRPRVSGMVAYSSGAPVQNAKVELSWDVLGSWPPPAAWSTPRGLPRSATTNASGAFSVELPVIPKDLQGQVTLSARVVAIDPAGDRVAGATSVLLSKDAIKVSAATPLGGGLIGGFNNRLYVRVTTPDGRPLPGAKIKVKKAWMPSDAGIDAELDVNSVGRLQIDPGAPVTIVIPAMPYRPDTSQLSVGGVSRTEASDLIADEEASLSDQTVMDRWLALLRPCGKWHGDEDEARVVLRINADGRVQSGGARGRLGQCVLARLTNQRLTSGRPRLYALTFQFEEPNLPDLSPSVTDAFNDLPEGVEELFGAVCRDARDCLPRSGDEVPKVLAWRLEKGSKKISGAWMPREKGPMPAGLERCVLSRLASHQLDEPAKQGSMGTVSFSLSQPGQEEEEEKPQDTTMMGYELLIAATVDGRATGQTRLRMKPGRIPPLTLRANPVLAQAGARITLELLRGPGFSGTLPREIVVDHEGDTKRLELKKKGQRKTTYTLPEGKSGWFSFLAAGQRALVFVRPPNRLSVSVKPASPRYAPGATAQLDVRTSVGDRPTKAAVGLFGVDQSLAQLVPLPGADALDGLRPTVTTSSKAFGVFDGQALTLGRILGEHAAEATILRVTTIPKPADLDVLVSGSGETAFDAVAELTDRFYPVLSELHNQVRAWEGSAPKNEQMTTDKMAKLWDKALSACKQRKLSINDAYGRRLRLHRLPPDLLALTDPRQVVVVGTRLPEDVENWSAWVARRKP